MSTIKILLTSCLSLLMTSVGLADIIRWTGDGNDHLWSNPENWNLKRIPADGDDVYVHATDEHSVSNDIDNLTLDFLVLTERTENPLPLTFVGKPLTLAAAAYGFNAMSATVVTNYVEITVTQAAYARFYNVVMMAPFHLQQESMTCYDVIGGGGVRFYGPVDGPSTTLKSSSASIRFYGPYDLKAVEGLADAASEVVFACEGGNCPLVKNSTYTDVKATKENAFPANAVLTFGSPKATTIDFTGSQTIDRLVSDGATLSTLRAISAAAILTLRGTASASVSAKIDGSASVVWAPVGDFTQTLTDQAHGMTGNLDVNGGTLESAGNNTFKSATGLRVAKGAAFKISSSASASAVNPFDAAKLAATISRGGKIVVPSGVTVTVKTLSFAGIPLPAGTYQSASDGADANATAVEWIEGEGLVSVAQVSGTGWKAAVSGNFSDADKWSNGLPSDTNKGYVSLETDTPYVVTLDGNAVLPSKLTVGGNVTLSVPTGVRQTFDGSSVAAAYEIKDGATVKVDGGELVFTNYHGTFTISGTGVETGRLAVAGGLFRYAPRKNPSTWYINRLQLMTGGAVDVTGGTFSIVVPEQGSIQDLNRNDLPVFRQQGGTFSLTGTGVYDQTSPVNPLPAFGTGLSLLAGHAVITNRKEMDVRPDAAGETAELIVKSFANVTGSAQLRVGGRAGGTSKVLFDDDLVFGPPTALTTDNGTATCIQIGNGEGTTLFEHRSGCIKPGQMGITIGGSTQFADTTTGCDALYRVTGGALDVLGKDNEGWGQLYGPMGLAVGCGYCTKNTTGRPYHGVLTIEAGGVTNNNGYTTIGGGMGRGEVVQTGGSFNAKMAYMAVGYGHGVGRYVISNGTATVGCPLYIGGCRLDRCGYSDKFKATHCPWLDLRDAEGTLSVAGGTFTVSSKTTTLGEDGAGTIEMDGSKGQLTLKDLVLTHTAANADSCGTLRFKLDADGVSPIKATSVTFDEKAKIEVNLGDYAGRSLKLVESVSVTGFDPDMVTITGARVKDATVKVTPAGLRLNLAQGMMILLR